MPLMGVLVLIGGFPSHASKALNLGKWLRRRCGLFGLSYESACRSCGIGIEGGCLAALSSYNYGSVFAVGLGSFIK